MLQKLPVGDSEWLKKHLNEDFMKNYDGDCGIGYFLFFFSFSISPFKLKIENL